MAGREKDKRTEFEKAAREAGEGKSLDDVLRQLVKPQPKKKGGTPKEHRPRKKHS